MTKSIFIFIASFLLVAPIVLAAGLDSPTLQFIFCMPFILLLGIPHGAIDNVLYSSKSGLSQTKFIAVYLFFVGLNVILWLVKPDLAYVSFLLLSAYHFGQSQFSHYLDNSAWSSKTLYLSWGIALLAALIFFNLEEINGIAANHEDFIVFNDVHNKEIIQGLFVGSLSLTVALLFYLTGTKKLSLENLFIEVVLLFVVLLCFYYMPLIIGFTLYFVILHSLKVLREEYSFLHTQQQNLNVAGFIKLVAPFTLVSIVGISFLFVLIALNVLTISFGYVFLIVISSITLPHAFVMNTFYSVLTSKRTPSPTTA